MLAQVRLAAVAQVVAVLVSASLSGAPRLAGLLAPPERHVCRCAEHGPGQQCTCSACRSAAAAAQANDASRPPCHRAPARTNREAAADRRPSPTSAPCLTGSCGALDPRPHLVAGVEPFLPPPSGEITAPPPGSRLPLVAARAASQAPQPEVPPPRPA